FLEKPLQQISQDLFVSGLPSDFIRHDAALFGAIFCDFCDTDPFTRVPKKFDDTFNPSGAPSSDAVKLGPLKPLNNISQQLNLAIEAMTSGALEPCSNIPELLNLAIEVTFITRQMLFGHRAPRTAQVE